MKSKEKLQLLISSLICIILLVPVSNIYGATGSEMNIYGLFLESDDKGESTLLESNGHYILMDLGSYSSIPAIVKHINNLKIKEIDLYFSHLHRDHYAGKVGGAGNTTAGLDLFLKETGVKINTLYLPDLSLTPESLDYPNIYAQIVKSSNATTVVPLKKDSTFTVGDVSAHVLGPVNTDKIHPADYTDKASSGDGGEAGDVSHTYYENNCCLITMFTCGQTKYLTVGDALETQTDYMADQYGDSLRADILQLSHHGTGSGNTEKFLNAVQPQFAFAQNTGLTGISTTTKKWLTNASRKNVIPYGMCYLTADEKKTIIYKVKDNNIRVYESDNLAESMMDNGWITLIGGDGQFRKTDLFYFQNGVPLKGVQHIDGHDYYFGKGGSMEYGNFNENGKYQYWKTYADGTKRYFTFSPDGTYSYMAKGFTKIGNELFYFDSNGFKVDSGLANEKALIKIGKFTYAVSQKGVITINDFATIKNNRYYFDSKGHMVTGFRDIDGQTYYFDSKTGKKIDGGKKSITYKIGKYTYLLGTSGAVIKDKVYRNKGKVYYFGKDGRMVTNTTRVILGFKFTFDKKGVGTKGSKVTSKKK